MNRTSITIRLPDDLINATNLYAHQQTRSTSNLIEHALRTYLKRYKKPTTLTREQVSEQIAEDQRNQGYKSTPADESV